jgi:hypothetical protein
MANEGRSLLLTIVDKGGEIVFTIAFGGPICMLASGFAWWLFRWAAGWS